MVDITVDFTVFLCITLIVVAYWKSCLRCHNEENEWGLLEIMGNNIQFSENFQEGEWCTAVRNENEDGVIHDWVPHTV